jgi:hypothetical protein
VRALLKKSTIIFLVGCVMIAAQDTVHSKIRIGVLNLSSSAMDESAVTKIDADLEQILSDMGFYKVYPQKDLEIAFGQIKRKFPAHCRDPRCVTEIGSSLGLDRMIVGSIDKNNNSFGVRMTLLDVPSRQIVEKVEMQGESGVSATDVLKTVVTRLHGLETSNNKVAHDYFGPEIHNEKQFLYSSGLCVGIGLIWAALNGGLGDFKLTKQFDTLSLSHLSSSSLQIPFFGRPAALADGYIAASDDAYGVIFNPAAMAWMPHAEMAVGYQYRFAMMNNFIASFANKATREIGFGECVMYSGDIDKLQTELHFISSYAYKFNRRILFLRPFSIGVALKLSTITSPQSEDATASQKTFGAGLDIGFMTAFADNIRFAAVLKDAPTINKVNNTTTGTRYLEYEPMLLQLGGTYQAGYSTFLICQGQIPLYEDQLWAFSGGIEQEFFRVFKARLGIKKQAYFNTPWLLTGGFGLDLNTESIAGKYISVDGAYEYNTIDVFPVANVSFRVGF